MKSINNTDFFSGATYLVLPKRKVPKVHLNIKNGAVARQAFKLYNPFSTKAKVLKSITRFLCIYFNPIAKRMLPVIKGEKSNFIFELEKLFGKKLESSIYFSTAKDKIVLQLLDDGHVLGYLKYAISPLGRKRVLNEKEAVNIISELNLIPKYLCEGVYENMPYVILRNLEGTITEVEPVQFQSVLESLKKQKTYTLIEHPRVLQIKGQLESLRFYELISRLDKAIKSSKKRYHEVYEHGDFAPWNLIEHNGELIPFDFEYFENSGLEHLDAIKYQFQTNLLLKKLNGRKLIEAIDDKIAITEFDLIFTIFLIKEILNKIEAGESYVLEISLLNILTS